MSEWIDAKEKVPQDDQRVLASCGGDAFFARYFASLQTWRRDPNETGLDQYVTHWMLIPAIPQTKKR